VEITGENGIHVSIVIPMLVTSKFLAALIATNIIKQIPIKIIKE
jgi:hypothetical protein